MAPTRHRNWRERFWYWLGYGDEPLPPEEAQLKLLPAVVIIDPSATAPFIAFIRAALNNSVPMPVSLSMPPLCGRIWWSNIDAPTLKEPDVREGWDTLMNRGGKCELLTWAETSCLPALTECFADTVLRFQYEETLIAENDACPLPWGTVSYQAAVAAYNAAWLVVARSEGAADIQVQGTRERLYLWLSSAPEMDTARAGDLILLHHFYEDSVKRRQALEDRVKTAEASH